MIDGGVRSGLQFSSYGHLGVGADRLFPALAEVASTAEAAGFDAVLVVDHFYGLPPYGGLDEPMLEAYTLLGALAARTERARLGTLVTGVAYRNPAVLAKVVTTLDVVSGGRALLGIGAGWFEQEHRDFGIDFAAVGDRFDHLEEAIAVCRSMFRDERRSFTGRFTSVRSPINRPRPLQADVPLLIGGSGERRTIPLMARSADIANFTADRVDLPRKLALLHEACEAVGRDPATLSVSWHGVLFVGRTTEEAGERRDRYLASRGVAPWAELAPERQARAGARWLCGDVATVAAQVEALREQGLDGITCTIPVPAADLEAFALAGAALEPMRIGSKGQTFYERAGREARREGTTT